MLNDEQKQIVAYLRMSPKDSLKRDAADLIEFLANEQSCNKSDWFEVMKQKILEYRARKS